MTDYAWQADQGDARALSELFVPDGVLCMGGQELTGTAQIEDFCQRRFSIPGRRTRHVWTNLRVTSCEDSRVRSQAIQLTFEPAGDGALPRVRVSDLFDEFQQDPTGDWRLARREVRPALDP